MMWYSVSMTNLLLVIVIITGLTVATAVALEVMALILPRRR